MEQQKSETQINELDAQVDILSCDKCDKTYSSQGSLTRHANFVHESKSFECDRDQCDKKYKMKDMLRRHQKAVHDGSQHACDKCDKIYPYSESLRRHIISIHEKDGGKEQEKDLSRYKMDINTYFSCKNSFLFLEAYSCTLLKADLHQDINIGLTVIIMEHFKGSALLCAKILM